MSRSSPTAFASPRRIWALFWLFGWAAACSDGSGASAATRLPLNIFVPYCGVYSVYAASIMVGHPIDFADLLRPEYVTSGSGSSLADLERASHDHALQSLAFANGTLSLLRAADAPVILHVTTGVGHRNDYSHFVTMLRANGDDFVILDPGHSVRTLDEAEVLSIWDRSGLVVSNKPIVLSNLFLRSWLELALLGILTIIIVAFLRRIPWATTPQASTGSRSNCCGRQCVAILTTVVACTYLYNSASATGFLKHRNYVSEVESEHFGSFLERVAPSSIEPLVRSGAILLDARFHDDFALGHIKGAINMPPNTDEATRTALLGGISRTSPIIVYCQTRECPLAISLASMLKSDGYMHLLMLDGGYEEWQKASEEARK
jgi:rhodanese-related sulfurtransferase